MPETLVLSAEDVRRVLPVRECIDVMREAFVALAEGRATVPVRTTLGVGDRDERLLLMPAVMRAPGGAGLDARIEFASASGAISLEREGGRDVYERHFSDRRGQGRGW